MKNRSKNQMPFDNSCHSAYNADSLFSRKGGLCVNLFKSPYRIDPHRPAARFAVLLMALCALIRCYYFARTGGSPGYLSVHLGLPLIAAAVFLWVVLRRGETHTGCTVISVLCGVIFFIVKALSFPSRLHTVLCILLYLTVLSLYSLTVLGCIPTKKLLYPLFGLPLLYHIFVEDTQLYIFADPPVPFLEWLPEISVLMIMAALLSISVALEKRDR